MKTKQSQVKQAIPKDPVGASLRKNLNADRTEAAERTVELLLRYRHWFLVAIIVVTVLLAYFSRSLQVDNTLKGVHVPGSPECRCYEQFVQQFGDDEFLLVVLFNGSTVYDQSVLKSVDLISREIGKLHRVESVLSLATIKSIRDRNGLLTTAPLLTEFEGRFSLPQPGELSTILAAIPKSDLLLSPDLKTVGILAQIDGSERYDASMGDLIRNVRSLVDSRLPAGSSYTVTGQPVIRDAFLRYNLQTAIWLSLLGTLIGWLVSLYVYKSLRISLIPLVVSSLSLIWVTGLMGLLGIPVSTATSMAFGLIIVITTITVVHIVVHYADYCCQVPDGPAAVRYSLATIGKPALICTLTTSAGFASIAVSDLPMVQHLGLIMAMGVFITYVLAIIVAPSLLIFMTPPKAYCVRTTDLITDLIAVVRRFIEVRHRSCLWGAVLAQVLLIAAIPSIHREGRLSNLFKQSVPEMRDISGIERSLAPVRSVEIILQGQNGAFEKPRVLQRVQDLQERLTKVPGVVRVDSVIPWLEYLWSCVQSTTQTSAGPLSDKSAFRDCATVTCLNSEGRRLMHAFLNRERSAMRLSVRVVNDPSRPLPGIVDAVRAVAEKEMKSDARITVTGELVIHDAAGAGLVRLQVISLVLAVSVITALLMVQFRSVTIALVSLIPNFMPILAIFGVMGLFGIRLDSVTVFAASFSIGLAADGTIHYLTHLRKAVDRGHSVQDSVGIAFQNTARPIVAATVILVLGFGALIFSPFASVIAGGILCSVGMLGAMLGDLLFMPSVILNSAIIRRYLPR